RLEAAKFYAEAEIERAKGVAEANRIVAEGLGGPDGYLRYLWINKLGENQQDVIYIPTEAGIPLLEAGRSALPK
ncbi:MAG: membrane protease subunit, partial [Pseudomonadota bacterium]